MDSGALSGPCAPVVARIRPASGLALIRQPHEAVVGRVERGSMTGVTEVLASMRPAPLDDVSITVGHGAPYPMQTSVPSCGNVA